MLETFLSKVAGLQSASFLERESVKFVKLLRTIILKNISKRLLLEVVYKKAVLKNFVIFIGGKQLVIKCSVKKVF